MGIEKFFPADFKISKVTGGERSEMKGSGRGGRGEVPPPDVSWNGLVGPG